MDRREGGGDEGADRWTEWRGEGMGVKTGGCGGDRSRSVEGEWIRKWRCHCYRIHTTSMDRGQSPDTDGLSRWQDSIQLLKPASKQAHQALPILDLLSLSRMMYIIICCNKFLAYEVIFYMDSNKPL